MTSLLVFELRKDMYVDLMFSCFTASLSFQEKQFKKALVNPSVLLLRTSKHKVDKLAVVLEEIFG